METLLNFSEPIIYLLVFGIVFSETGILPCFFLPGDSLLFSLGLFAQQKVIGLSEILLVVFIAGFLGNILGYATGKFLRDKRASSNLLKRVPESHIEKTETFFRKYGIWAILISKFIPVVRTIAPFLAGVSKMHYKKFFILSLVGSAVWAVVVILSGYLFGSYLKNFNLGILTLSLMIGASVVVPLIAWFLRKVFKKG